MSHKECKDVVEKIEETVFKTINTFINKQEKICKRNDCNWWCLCCNKWICWISTTLVKGVATIIEKTTKYITHVVCEIVLDTWDFVRLIVEGVGDMFIGIISLNWRRFLDGIIKIIEGGVDWITGIIRIIFLGDLINFIIKEINTANLKAHVKERLEAKYSGATLQKIKDAIGLEVGAFGLRLKAKARRGYVDSEYRADGTITPSLLLWHNTPTDNINIKRLAGFHEPYYGRRFRPEIIDTTDGDTLGGGGGSPPKLSESQLDDWINSGGTNGTKFIINSVTEDALDLKLRSASSACRDLGLIITWEKDRVQLITPKEVLFDALNGTDVPSQVFQANFLKRIGRASKSANPSGARTDLCTPYVVSVFYYWGELAPTNGQVLNGLTCRYTIRDASGCTFRDRMPDLVWRWVPAHELGHYFDLDHVDGYNNIMYGAEMSGWSWSLLLDYFYLAGEPTFSYEEGKRAWDFIVTNFSVACLSTRHE